MHARQSLREWIGSSAVCAFSALLFLGIGSASPAAAQQTEVTPVAAPAQIRDHDRLVAALDSAARAHVADEGVAGVSVAVVRGTDTLLMRGYGYADLEWAVPTPADASASYEIGSVTKQFTAVADGQVHRPR